MSRECVQMKIRAALKMTGRFTFWKLPVSLGITQMMGSPMHVSRVIFQDCITMKDKRKTNRAVYHMTRLSFSLSASLMSLVSVVTRDTSSPETKGEAKKQLSNMFGPHKFCEVYQLGWG